MRASLPRLFKAEVQRSISLETKPPTPVVHHLGVAVERFGHPDDGTLDPGAGHDVQGLRPRPDHEGGAAVSAVQGRSLVAGRFVQPLAVGLGAVERARRQQLAGLQRDFRERRPSAVPTCPAVEPALVVEYVVDVHFRDVVLVPVPSMAVVPVEDVVAVERRLAGFFDVDDGRVQFAPGALRRRRQHLRHGRVGALQRGEGQPRCAVLVVEQPDQLVGRAFLAAPCGELLRDPGDLPAVVGRLARGVPVPGAQAQVEHQREAMAFEHRPDLVRAVGVEGRERQLGGLFRVHVDGDLAVLVADDQLAAGARDRQGDREGCDHAVGLLGVAVRQEEPARLVDEQLVELGVEPLARAAETRRRGLEDARERLRPRVPFQPHPLRVDLPAVADRGVHQRLRPLAVGCPLGRLDQGAYLRLGHRKGHHAGAFDLQPWHGREQPAVGAEVARPADGAQQSFKLCMAGAVFDVGNSHDDRLRMSTKQGRTAVRGRAVDGTLSA